MRQLLPMQHLTQIPESSLAEALLTRISESGGRGCHDGGHKRVGLRDGGIVDVQPLHGDAIEGRVIQHHHRISIQRQALQGEQGVVGLDHHIARLALVWKHAALHRVLLSLAAQFDRNWSFPDRAPRQAECQDRCLCLD